MKRELTWLFLVLGMYGFAVHAESGRQLDIRRFAPAGGGGVSSGGSFRLTGTAGQPHAATLAAGSYRLQGGFWTTPQAIQVPGAPRLNITVSGTNAIVSWSIETAGFVLQETSSLASPAWGPTPQAVVDTALEHTVTVPAASPMKWFRLQHQ